MSYPKKSQTITNTAQMVMGTTNITEPTTAWVPLVSLGGVTVSTRNNSSSTSQVLTQYDGTLPTMWTDNQSAGDVATIDSTGVFWTLLDVIGLPRNIEINGAADGKQFRIKLMYRVTDKALPTQSVRCTASITVR